MTSLSFLRRHAGAVSLALALVLAGLVGWLDYITGPRISLGIFYLLPVSLAVWSGGRRQGIVLAFACAAIWLAADWYATAPHKAFPVHLWNAGVRLGFFLTVGLLLSSVRARDLTLASMVDERTAALRDEVAWRKRVEQSLRLQHQLVASLGATSDLGEALNLILDATIGLGGTDCGGIRLVDEQTGAVDLAVHRGVGERFVRWAVHSDATSPEARMVMGGIIQYVDRADVRPIFRELGEDLHSVAVIPVRHQGRVTACLNLGSHTADKVDVGDRELLETIAGNIGGVIARIRAEEALRQSEARYRTLVEQLPAVTYTAALDESSTTLYISPQVEDYLGYTPADYTRNPNVWQELLHPDDRQRVMDEVHQAQRAGRPLASEYRMVARDGRTIWFRDQAVIVRDAAGQPLILQGVMFDITARKQAEDELRRSEATNRALIAAIPDLLVRLGRTARILGFIPSGGEEPDLVPDKFVGRRVMDILPPAVADLYAQALDRLFATRQPQVLEYALQVPLPDGPTRYYEGRLVVAGHDEALLMVRNITARKQAEEELRRSEATNRALVQAIPDLMYHISRDGVYLDVVKVGAFELSRHVRENKGKTIHQVLQPELASRIARALDLAFRTDQTQVVEFEVQLPTGQKRYREARLVVSGENEALVLTRDITDRRQAEEELRRSEATNRALLQAMPDMIFRISGDGTYLDFIPGGGGPPAIPREQFLGRNVREVFPPEFAERVLAVINAAIRTGQVQLLEYRFPIPTFDGAPREYEARWAVCGDNEVMAIVRNVTARRQAEQRLLAYQEQLRSLASELSLAEERERRRIAADLHDRIGQQLALVRIRLGVLRGQGLGPQAVEALDETRSLLEQTIQDTRSLTFELSPPVLYELGFEAAAEWLADQVRHDYGIEVEVADDGQAKPMDDDIRVVLFQALRELLVNAARHAHASRVKVSLDRDGDTVRVLVADDGVGFEPNQTAGAREGFGLFSLRERLGHLGGQMEVDSAPGRGSQIHLAAPLKRSHNPPGRTPDEHPNPDS